MKVLLTETTLWWVALIDEIKPLKTIVTPIMVRDALQSKFSFGQIPSAIKFGEGVEYQDGVFFVGDRPILINKLVTFNDGLNIVVSSVSEDADAVLSAVMEILASFGVREPMTPPNKTYVSNAVVEFDYSLDAFFPPLFLRKMPGSIGIPEASAHSTALTFGLDPMTINPRVFAPGDPGLRIERRKGAPFSVHRYFSAANMPTTQHLELLQMIEDGLRERQSAK